MNTENVSVSKIKTMRYNPQYRLEEHVLAPLLDSIRRVGIINPLIVGDNNNLIDGHRRLKCAKILGMATVPTIKHDGDVNELYQEVNTTARRLTNADYLAIYYAGGNVGVRRNAKLDKIKEIVGDEIIKYAVTEGVSYTTIIQGIEAAKLIGYTNVPKLVVWLIKYKLSYRLRRVLEDRMPFNKIIKLIESDKPILRTWK
jgi:hypothetical protein